MKLFKLMTMSTLFALFFCHGAYANIKIDDSTNQFIKGYQLLKIKNLPATKKYIIHYETVVKPSASRIFFDGMPLPRDPRIELTLNQYAKNLPSIIKQYQIKVPEIKAIVAEVQQRTQKLFGQEINANVILATSVSMTDAVTTGSNDNKYPTVALNLREVSNYSKDEIKIVLSHELFHVLQHQIEVDHSNNEPIAGNLYSEGWATYASSLVYPGYEDWKYISYFTKNNHQFIKFEAEKPAIIKNILKDWNTKSERRSDKYFSADPFISKPFEPRSGYYIGYLAAKTLAKKSSPVQVALIKYDDYIKQIKPLLKEISKDNYSAQG